MICTNVLMLIYCLFHYFSLLFSFCLFFFFSSRRRHTRCALVTGVQTCALPISDACRSTAAHFLRPNRMGEFVEHAIDELVAVLGAEHLGEIDRLIDGNLPWHVRAMLQFIGGEQQDRMFDRINLRDRDRKSLGYGKGVSVRLSLGGGRSL